MSVRDRIQRRVVPQLVVALSTVSFPRRAAAAVRRALGGSGTVRLFFAFDDPYSAIALIGLADRIEGRRVRLILEPVIERGIPGDPAREAKRRYAIADSSRLGRDLGLALSRSEPVDADAVSFLAGWAAAVPDGPARVEFCLAAMRRLWFEPGAELEEAAFEPLWRAGLNSDPPPEGGSGPAEQRMRRRRLYDTPVAVVHGQWFFAHERLPQIGERLDELGWRMA